MELDNALLVDKAELLDALGFLNKTIKASKRRSALISFDGAQISLQVAQVNVKVGASGNWNGKAAVSARLLLDLGKRLKAAQRQRRLREREFFTLKLSASRLWLDNDALPIIWRDEEGDLIYLPQDAEMLEVLALRHQHSYEELARSNLLYHIEVAEIQRDKVIRAALKTLAPLQIERSELEQFVDDSIRRKFGTHGGGDSNQ